MALLPEHWTGWVGRPGLSGSRQGRDWSPKFASTAVRVDGGEVEPQPGGWALHTAGPGRVEVDATDDEAQLALTVEIALEPSGLLRLQARLTNLAEDAYQVDDCVLALPVPQVGREILDFAGRWGKERTPQRRELHGRHPPARGPQGPHRTGRRHGAPRRRPRLRVRRRRGVGGPHRVERQPHPLRGAALHRRSRSSAAGSCCCPESSGSARGETYTTPWLYGSYGDGLDPVARRFHRYLRARPRTRAPTGRSRSTCGRPSTSTTTSSGSWTSPSGRPPSASSATSSTTAGSAAVATTTPAWVTGRSPPTCGRTGCTPWSTG